MSSWVWVAPVATATTGVIGIVIGWWTGRQGRDHVERISEKQYAHERLLAEEARKQNRIENAYVLLLEMSERAGLWAQRANRLYNWPVPPLPDDGEQVRVEALIQAFGSPEVRTLMKDWRAIIKDMIETDWQIKEEKEDRTGREEGAADPRLTFSEVLRPKELAAREELAHRIGVELGHREDEEKGTPAG
ncbi:hypothetical protein AXA44_40535 [Rhodococcus sp. SC4]|nr:hypothetical protein AXA44_40535 [Rhodococcus sp. SC4]